MKENKFSRRDFLRAGALTAAGAALAGCCPAEATPEQVVVTQVVEREGETVVETQMVEQVVTAEPAAPEVRRIAFWTPVSQADWDGELFYAITQQFNEEHSGEMYAEYVYTPLSTGRLGMSNLSEKLLTNIAAGTPPEAAYMDRFLVISWAAQGSLSNIKDYLDAEGISGDDYIEAAWMEGVWKGGAYCLPLFTGTCALYYNKEHVRATGRSGEVDDFPTGEGSLGEFDALVEEMTIREGPRYTQIGFIPWYGMNVYQMGYIFGGQFYDDETMTFTFDDPRVIQALEWMVSYVNNYDIEKIDAAMEGFGGQAQHGFTSGQVSTQFRWVGNVETHRKYNPDLDFWVVKMPHPEGGRPNSYLGGWCTVVPKNDDMDAAEAGFEFINYFANEENMFWFCKEAGRMPAHLATLNDPVFTEDPIFQPFWDVAEGSYSRPRVPIAAELWTRVRAEVQDRLIHKGTDPAEEMRNLNEWANEAIAPYRD